jgi:glycosyltransferase involved in cell wall biosynthesis
MLDITVVIITFNESMHLKRCIDSVRGFAKAIIVVDSFSTDETVDIARKYGARVLQNRFISHSKQFQWGLDNSDIATKWIMRLDADEIIEEDLASKLERDLPSMQQDIVGLNFDRKHIFMGRWIKHGGRYPVRLLRVWRTGQGRVEDRWMDEHIVVWGGKTITMHGGFSDINLNNLSYFINKHNEYATREALVVLDQKYGLFGFEDTLPQSEKSIHRSSKRFLKEKFYNKLPFWIGPLSYFIYRYVFQLGFLDGRPGIIYHFLQGFWYRFLVGAKVVEFDEALSDCHTNADRIIRLQHLTGLRLREINHSTP